MNSIDEEISNHQTKYIVITFQDSIENIDCKKTVDQIKKHYDLFIILMSDIPKEKKRIEEYFTFGVHGLCFIQCSNESYSEEAVEIITFATDLFANGWIFACINNSKKIVEQLISLKVVPVLCEPNPELLKFIKSHPNFNKISPNLKSIPLLDQENVEYSFAEKIKMKMLLETMNLRQKLMIKNVDESFGSSGL